MNVESWIFYQWKFLLLHLAVAVLRGLKIETVWWNCLSVPIFICMQIGAFSQCDSRIGRLILPSSCRDLLEHSRLSLGGAYWKLNWQLRRRKRAKSYEPWFKFMQLMIRILRRMLRCRKSWKEFNKKTHPFLPFPRSKFLLLQSWSCLRNDIRIMEMKRSPPYTSLTMKP